MQTEFVMHALCFVLTANYARLNVCGISHFGLIVIRNSTTVSNKYDKNMERNEREDRKKIEIN